MFITDRLTIFFLFNFAMINGMIFLSKCATKAGVSVIKKTSGQDIPYQN